MFATAEYSEYARLNEIASNIYICSGECPEYFEAQEKANDAYEIWEYAYGLKTLED